MLKSNALIVFLLVRILIELLKNEFYYTSRVSHLVGPLNEVIKSIIHNYSFLGLYEIAAMSNVLECSIYSVYPIIDYRPELDIVNRTLEYAQSTTSSKTVFIFWTHTQSESHVCRINTRNWTPNHFVPLLLSPDYSHTQNDFTQPRIVGPGPVRSIS